MNLVNDYDVDYLANKVVRIIMSYTDISIEQCGKILEVAISLDYRKYINTVIDKNKRVLEIDL